MQNFNVCSSNSIQAVGFIGSVCSFGGGVMQHALGGDKEVGIICGSQLLNRKNCI